MPDWRLRPKRIWEAIALTLETQDPQLAGLQIYSGGKPLQKIIKHLGYISSRFTGFHLIALSACFLCKHPTKFVAFQAVDSIARFEGQIFSRIKQR